MNPYLGFWNCRHNINTIGHCFLQRNDSFSHTFAYVSKGALEIRMETSGHNTICREPAREHNGILSLKEQNWN